MEFDLDDLKNKKFHFIGIGGISMSALAFMLKKEKIYVQGSDESENDEIKKLKKKGILVFKKHKKENLKNIDIVVYSSAILDDNEELKNARLNNLIILKRAQLLAMVASKYKTIISIAGSHGKTTTTAMISEMFLYANLKPTLHLGGELKKINSNYKIGNKNFFITESCEYKDNFLYLHPDISVILNIDADHLDYFGDLNGVKKSFLKFSKNIKQGGINIVCKDDENSSKILKSANLVTFGLKNSDISAINIKEYETELYSFDVIFQQLNIGNVKLNIFGKHNIYNALASIMVGLLCGIDFCDIKFALENFSGTKRRTEYIGEFKGAKIYHDYAHHPSQIKEMLKIGNHLAESCNGRFIVVYEPHTYSRTKYLINEFIEVFKSVDKLYLAPVYSARENLLQGFSSDYLCDCLKKENIDCTVVDDYKKIKFQLLSKLMQGDIVFILGAGSIEKLAKNFKNMKNH